MSVASQPLGRRERNKQQKLDRITAAASELFAEHGVEDVTTQQIADKADIGTGTLFLYAKTKGELLLLVQNTHYAEACRNDGTHRHRNHVPQHGSESERRLEHRGDRAGHPHPDQPADAPLSTSLPPADPV
jgi:hypothetical protein